MPRCTRVRAVVIAIFHNQHHDQQRAHDNDRYPKHRNAEQPIPHDDREFFVHLEDQTEARKSGPFEDIFDLDYIDA